MERSFPYQFPANPPEAQRNVNQKEKGMETEK